MAKEQGHLDRVARIRRMIEGDADPKEEAELFARAYVSTAPWDLAVKRVAKSPAEAAKASFDPSHFLTGMRITVEDAVEDCDKVVVRWRLRGTWSQAFLGTEPTNRPIDITGLTVYRFVGDKIVEKTGELDAATLAQQTFGGLSAAACVKSLQTLSRPAETVQQG